MPTPDAHLGHSATGTCVAPTYPEWCVTEDWDRVWVRLDLAHRAEEVVDVVLHEVGYHEPAVLCEVGRVPLWEDRVDTEWSDDWMLREVDPVTADEAVVYVEYEVCDA